mmetsp:Transcript_6049/g.14607  ORF Transcript_6049/g.14607 Transcript_6049/m.14607 type:complete len:446 (-) Transcript_6049:124-1461(-)
MPAVIEFEESKETGGGMGDETNSRVAPQNPRDEGSDFVASTVSADLSKSASEELEGLEQAGGTRETTKRCNSQNAALFLMFLSAVFFSVMGIFVKLASNEGISPFQLVFSRAVFQGILVFGFIIYKRIPFFGNPGLRPWILARGLIGGSAFICYFVTITLLPIGDSITLASMYPAATVLIARCVLKEPLTVIKVMAVFMCAIGAVLIAQPVFIFGRKETRDGEYSDYAWVGYITAVGGSVLGAIVFVIMRRAKEAHTAQLIWSWCVGSAMLSILLGNTMMRMKLPSTQAWMQILPMSLFGLVGHSLFNYAGQLAPAGLGASIRSSDVVFAYIWEFTVFGEAINWVTILGAFIVLLGITTIAYSKYSQSRNQRVNLSAALSTSHRESSSAYEKVELELTSMIEDDQFDDREHQTDSNIKNLNNGGIDNDDDLDKLLAEDEDENIGL